MLDIIKAIFIAPAVLLIAAAILALMGLLGALFGWLTVYLLSQVFTFDYEIGRTVGLVVGTLLPLQVVSGVKD